jgi:hypothetical protein
MRRDNRDKRTSGNLHTPETGDSMAVTDTDLGRKHHKGQTHEEETKKHCNSLFSTTLIVRYLEKHSPLFISFLL